MLLMKKLAKMFHVRTVTANRLKRSAPLALACVAAIACALVFARGAITKRSAGPDTVQKVHVSSSGGASAGEVAEAPSNDGVQVCVIGASKDGRDAYVLAHDPSGAPPASAVRYMKKDPALKGLLVEEICGELPSGCAAFKVSGEKDELLLDDLSVAVVGSDGRVAYVYGNTSLSKIEGSDEFDAVLDEAESGGEAVEEELNEPEEEESAGEEGGASVTVIDVGQGLSALIECDGHAALVDAGGPSSGTTVRSVLKSEGVDALDYLVLTHPDADHIGGAASVVSNVDIGRVFGNGVDADTKAYDALVNEMSFKSMEAEVPKLGESYPLGSASMVFYGPVGGAIEGDDNNSSLVVKVEAGKRGDSVLITGDAEDLEEALVLSKYKKKLASTVLVVGHHGSASSTTPEFLNAVSPSVAVISVGNGNSYGHPSSEVVERLEDFGAEVRRTDTEGNVKIVLSNR